MRNDLALAQSQTKRIPPHSPLGNATPNIVTRGFECECEIPAYPTCPKSTFHGFITGVISISLGVDDQLLHVQQGAVQLTALLLQSCLKGRLQVSTDLTDGILESLFTLLHLLEALCCVLLQLMKCLRSICVMRSS